MHHLMQSAPQLPEEEGLPRRRVSLFQEKRWALRRLRERDGGAQCI